MGMDGRLLRLYGSSRQAAAPAMCCRRSCRAGLVHAALPLHGTDVPAHLNQIYTHTWTMRMRVGSALGAVGTLSRAAASGAHRRTSSEKISLPAEHGATSGESMHASYGMHIPTALGLGLICSAQFR